MQRQQQNSDNNTFLNHGSIDNKGIMNIGGSGNQNIQYFPPENIQGRDPRQEEAKWPRGAAQSPLHAPFQSTNQTQRPLNLFYCYAREDKALLDELDTHLSTLRRTHLISTWYDGMIVPGTSWEEAIKEKLEQADLILLLISSAFINSDYCYSREMFRALQRHQQNKACVIPVLLRSVYWANAPFSHLQVLPSNGKPIESSSWPYRDEAFEDVATGIRRAIAALHKQ
jgi:hypothetical protein